MTGCVAVTCLGLAYHSGSSEGERYRERERERERDGVAELLRERSFF